ncbi:MAG: YncE family protein [Deltaproteobacteria bacterium]|nr:YncE family protein [Deltaproteobacteria bacterium]
MNPRTVRKLWSWPWFALVATALVGGAVFAAEERPPTPARRVRVLERVATAAQPKGVTVSPDGKTLVVTNFGRRTDKNIYFYDAETLELTAQIDLESANVVESVWAPDGNTVYVSDFRNNQVMFIDPATHEIRQKVDVESEPKILVLTPDGSKLFASCWAHGYVSAVDTATGEVLGKVRVGTQPRGMAVSPDGTKLYVGNHGSHDLHEIDIATLTVTRQADLVARSFPRHMLINRAGDRLYISSIGKRAIYVVSTDTLEIVDRIGVGECPKTIVFSPDEKWLYAADYCSHEVSVVDLETLGARQVAIPDINQPSGLAINADGTRLWVTGWSSAELVALEIYDPE